MADFLFLMHDDVVHAADPEAWATYFVMLRERGAFEGGSAIGGGRALRKIGHPASMTVDIGGYIRVQAEDLDAAAALLAGNPVYEAGGTVEIRELPRS